MNALHSKANCSVCNCTYSLNIKGISEIISSQDEARKQEWMNTVGSLEQMTSSNKTPAPLLIRNRGRPSSDRVAKRVLKVDVSSWFQMRVRFHI